jgi:sugar phosphate isomerase/epimerase
MKHNFTRREFIKATAAAGLAGLAQPLAAAKEAWQIGAYTRPWDKFEYRVALDGIAEAGYKYAGIMTSKGKNWVTITLDSTPEEVAEVAKEVKTRGLKTISIYAGDFPVAKSMEAGIAGLKTLIDHSALCSCPNLMLGGTANEQLYDAYYKVVAECCDYAVSKGVGLSVKPHGGKNATGQECRKIINKVHHKDFRIWYDPGNIYYYSDGKLDPVTDAATVDGLVVGMSVKDFRLPKEVLVTPGKGMVDFPKVFARLKQGGFTHGPLVVECLEQGDAKQITAEAKQAREFLEKLTGQRD